MPFDPVIDWADEEAEREWPLFGSLDGSLKATEATDRRSARGAAGGGRPTVSDDSDSETRRARPAPGRAPGGGGGGGGGGGDGGGGAGGGPIASARAGRPLPELFSDAQPRRGRDWVNPAGVRATFAVNTCGVPPAVRARQAPWPACRVLLVGCPGGRSAPDADPAKPACARGGTRALEMVPESDFEKHGLGSFSVTTSMYGPGDEFAFAMVKPGCTDAQIARALRAQGARGRADGSGAAGLGKRRVEVRLDSGFPMGNQLLNPGTRTTRCWTPNDAVTDTHRVAGDALCESVGASSEAREKENPRSSLLSAAAREETRKKVSPRESPLSPFEARGDTCLLRRDAAYARGKFHRVVPSLEADAKELGSAVKKEGAISSPPRVSFVWGTCDAQPRSEAWCAPPTFGTGGASRRCAASSTTSRRSSLRSVSRSSLDRLLLRRLRSGRTRRNRRERRRRTRTNANANANVRKRRTRRRGLTTNRATSETVREPRPFRRRFEASGRTFVERQKRQKRQERHVARRRRAPRGDDETDDA